MNILSIDTSTHKTSIALAIDKKVYEQLDESTMLYPVLITVFNKFKNDTKI